MKVEEFKELKIGAAVFLWPYTVSGQIGDEVPLSRILASKAENNNGWHAGLNGGSSALYKAELLFATAEQAHAARSGDIVVEANKLLARARVQAEKANPVPAAAQVESILPPGVTITNLQIAKAA